MASDVSAGHTGEAVAEPAVLTSAPVEAESQPQVQPTTADNVPVQAPATAPVKSPEPVAAAEPAPLPMAPPVAAPVAAPAPPAPSTPASHSSPAPFSTPEALALFESRFKMLEEQLRQRDSRIQELERHVSHMSPTPSTPPPVANSVGSPSSESDAKRVRKMSSRYDEFAQPRGTAEATRAMLVGHPDALPPNLAVPFSDVYLKRAKGIVQSLLKMRQAVWFNEPVNEERLGIKDYYTIIKNPMDLRTITEKLDHKQYQTVAAWVSDMRLIWLNCRAYNAPDHPVTLDCNALEKAFEEKLAKFSAAVEADRQKAAEPVPVVHALAHDSPAAPGKRKSSFTGVEDPRAKRAKTEPTKKPKLSSVMRACRNLLEYMTSDAQHPYNVPFLQPVDVVRLNLPDYLTIIKKPMDLGTVGAKLDAGEYATPGDFAADVRLVFSNCLLYNPRTDPVSQFALKLQKTFDKRFNKIAPEENDSDSDVAVDDAETVKQKNLLRQLATLQNTVQKLTGGATSSAKKPKHKPEKKSKSSGSSKSSESPSSHKKKKSKSDHHDRHRERSRERRDRDRKHKHKSSSSSKSKKREENKMDVEMTFEEKKRLSEDVNLLPPDKLPKMIEIIHRSHPNAKNSQGEIEIDINQLDTRTLREMERYVRANIRQETPAKKSKSSSSKRPVSSSDSDSSSSGSDSSDSEDERVSMSSSSSSSEDESSHARHSKKAKMDIDYAEKSKKASSASSASAAATASASSLPKKNKIMPPPPVAATKPDMLMDLDARPAAPSVPLPDIIAPYSAPQPVDAPLMNASAWSLLEDDATATTSAGGSPKDDALWTKFQSDAMERKVREQEFEQRQQRERELMMEQKKREHERRLESEAREEVDNEAMKAQEEIEELMRMKTEFEREKREREKEHSELHMFASQLTD